MLDRLNGWTDLEDNTEWMHQWTSSWIGRHINHNHAEGVFSLFRSSRSDLMLRGRIVLVGTRHVKKDAILSAAATTDSRDAETVFWYRGVELDAAVR